MKRWLKGIDGAVGMGLIWAVGGGIVAPLSDVFDAVFLGGATGSILWDSLLGAFFGFIGGGVFSVALAIAGRRRRFDEMSLPRFAALGALAPSLIIVALAARWWVIGGIGGFGVLFIPSTLGFATVLALMGAGYAAGTLALARKAEDRELLGAGADVAEVGLTKEEKAALLGK